MKKQITNLIHQIKSDYGNDAYVGLTGDRRFENVSPNLCRLWGSIEEMSIGSLDTYYYRVFDDAYPDYTIEKFEEDALSLKDALAQEFERFDKANIMKGDQNNEGFDVSFDGNSGDSIYYSYY